MLASNSIRMKIRLICLSGLSVRFFERFLQEPWNRYPSTFADEAVAQYANFIGVPKECVMMGNGSNELIYTIFLAILRRTASVLIPAPSFSLYDKVAALLEAEILHVAMTPSLEFDTEQILRGSRTQCTSAHCAFNSEQPDQQGNEI